MIHKCLASFCLLKKKVETFIFKGQNIKRFAFYPSLSEFLKENSAWPFSLTDCINNFGMIVVPKRQHGLIEQSKNILTLLNVQALHI